MRGYPSAVLYRQDACPRCRSAATTSSSECRACGHAWGVQHACVHCGVTCGVRHEVEFLPGSARCEACDVPRIAIDWTMPAELAANIRRAYWANDREERLAVGACIAIVAWIFVGPPLCIWRGWGLMVFAAPPITFIAALVVLGGRQSRGRELAKNLERARTLHAEATRHLEADERVGGDVVLLDEEHASACRTRDPKLTA